MAEAKVTDGSVLEEIARILNDGALNYNVFLKWFETPLPQAQTSTIAIENALGAAVKIGGIEEVQRALVWSLIENDLLYPGDDGAGPSELAIISEKLATLLHLLKEQVNALAHKATKVESFWLSNGHPAYPVFWDFAFLFMTDTDATILIGSSSD